ncbi:MAG: hypothetical protein ACR652_21755 [Methylocystis sp.]|uniref:hypothetical protein n=1 Tax=Methylocystis sp. TaxID=1911079 RepID=UPI003DA3881E
MQTFNLLSRTCVCATLAMFGFVSTASAKQECRDGTMFDDVAAKPVIDPNTGKVVRCGASVEGDASLSSTALLLGGAVAVGAGVGIAAATGAFKGSASQQFVPPAPLSGQ